MRRPASRISVIFSRSRGSPPPPLHFAWSESAYMTTATSGLLSSWTTPAVSLPRPASFSACSRAASSCLSRAVSSRVSLLVAPPSAGGEGPPGAGRLGQHLLDRHAPLLGQRQAVIVLRVGVDHPAVEPGHLDQHRPVAGLHRGELALQRLPLHPGEAHAQGAGLGEEDPGHPLAPARLAEGAQQEAGATLL